MTNFTTDEYGNHTFTHGGWTVHIWSWAVQTSNRICIKSPHRGEEVEVNEDGVWVNGESSGGWHGPDPNAFTIPWAVIEAIIEARQILTTRDSN